MVIKYKHIPRSFEKTKEEKQLTTTYKKDFLLGLLMFLIYEAKKKEITEKKK
jgi:hypothetical protein